MSTNTCWVPGDHITLRGVWRQRLWFACPVTVVQDTSALIALYWQAGTRVKVPGKRFTPQDMLSSKQLDLVDKTWTKTDVLMLVIPGTAHSVYAMWEKGHTNFRCWYINLQEPLRRTSIGFDTMDHLLDIVSPDRTEWWWKDEDEFMEAEAIGVYSSEKAHAIREEGKRAIELLQDDRSPYRDEWKEWSPPMEWEIAELPVGWDNMAVNSGLPMQGEKPGRSRKRESK